MRGQWLVGAIVSVAASVYGCGRLGRRNEIEPARARDVVIENQPVASAMRELSQALALPVVIASDAVEVAACVRVSVIVARSVPRQQALRLVAASLEQTPLDAQPRTEGWIVQRRPGVALPESCSALAARRSYVPMEPRYERSRVYPPPFASDGGGLLAGPSEALLASVLAGITPIDDATYTMTRSALDALISNSARFATQLRAFSLYEGGAPRGTKLFSIRADAVWRSLGLESGDTLIDINGLPLNDDQEILRAVGQLSTMSELRLHIRRRQLDQVLTYRIIEAPTPRTCCSVPAPSSSS